MSAGSVGQRGGKTESVELLFAEVQKKEPLMAYLDKESPYISGASAADAVQLHSRSVGKGDDRLPLNFRALSNPHMFVSDRRAIRALISCALIVNTALRESRPWIQRQPVNHLSHRSDECELNCVCSARA